MNYVNFVTARLQPFHIGHQKLIQAALDAGDENAITVVFIGSANKAGSIDNPFTYQERLDMVMSSFQSEVDSGKLLILPLVDYDYDDETWEEDLHKQLRHAAAFKFGVGTYFTPNFFTCGKGDDAQLRIKWARGANIVVVDSMHLDGAALSATEIRQRMVDSTPWVAFAPEVMQVINEDRLDDVVCSMRSQKEKAQKYQESFAGCPFQVQFSATDAVIRDTTGRLLFIVRGGEFGQGCLAMAGGFLEPELTYEQNMKKEVHEEVGINLDVIPHTIVTSWMCDNPKRDIRGRMTTMAFLVQLQCTFEELEIKAGDDAVAYKLIDGSTLMNYILWADHAGIVRKLLHLEELGVRYIPSH